ncbi:hypothetical protein [Glutamicibacter uratoxydans]|uniref:hypothetical protein n=1 Tax=Glutamicibacter uratoxydans TaxID=43667 RepID=UPI0011431B09|nr:hypothetical protein [Glutamicibacter uratoxydans]
MQNSDEAFNAFQTNYNNIAEGMIPTDSWNDLRLQVPQIIEQSVHAIQRELDTGVDLWDVIEVLRRMIAPADLGEHKESINTTLPAIVEVVALIGISIDPKEINLPQEQIDAGPSIPTIIDAATRIVTTAQWVAIASVNDNHLGQAAELTGLLRTFEVSVRGRNYLSISRKVLDEIFSSEAIEQLVRSNVGYTPSDISQLWEAIQKERIETQTLLEERIGEFIQISSTGEPLSDAQITEAREVVGKLLLEPGQGISFSIDEILSHTNLSTSVITSILESFSIETTGLRAVEACQKFVQGENLLAGKGMLRRQDRYLPIGDPLPHDFIRPLIESRLKTSNKPWNRYRKHRDSWTEKTAGQLLSKLLGINNPTYESLEYRFPESDSLPYDLSKNSTNSRTNTKDTEADALFIIDDIAICVEVKAGSITEKARAGNVQRVEADLRKTIGEAASQAERLEDLILKHQGLWTPANCWIDLSGIREIHTIIVCLDDWGPLAIATDALVRANIITSQSIPWLVSIHDLFTIATFMDSPSDFLTYLRRRTDPAASRLLLAGDELDLVMWFMGGGLYFVPDPFEVRKKNPTIPRPRQAQRDEFKNSNVPTQVSTHTDALDAWMYFIEGQTSIEADRPRRDHQRHVAMLIQHLEDSKERGWLRTGADLAGLAHEAELTISDYMIQLMHSTLKDGCFHTSFMNFPDLSGNFGLFLGTLPIGESMEKVKIDIRKYAQLKKHQLHLGRSLAIIINVSGHIVWSEYDNSLNVDAPELDREIIERRLLSANQMQALNSIAPKNKKRKKRQKRKR